MIVSHFIVNRLSTFILGGTSLLMVGACSVLPTLGVKGKVSDVQKVRDLAPGGWSAAGAPRAGAATGWLSEFGSAPLNRLVDQAIAGNRDLRVAAGRVREARAQVRVVGADLLPQIGADAAGSRSQRASGQRFVGLGTRDNRFQVTADIAWELDFWGRLRDERGAVLATAEAEEADLHAARLSLAANTVKAAVTLAEAEAQIAIAQENVRRRTLHLGVLEKQLDRGLDADRSALDVSLSRADLARAESTLASRKREADAGRRSLETLLGSYPAGKESGLGGLPIMKSSVPVGLPSELLLRRPDLIAAERRLDSALQETSAAKKAFLPSFRLTGNSGYSTQELSQLLTPESIVWSVAGALAQNVFQGGRIAATADAARARYGQALEQYAADVLEAFREVETALAAEVFLREQEASLVRAAAEAETAVRLAIGQYERGLSDVLTLLDAQQRVFDSNSALIGVRAQRLRNRADLHLALGGDFN